MPRPRTATIEERFNEFHTAHPEVWTLFVRFSHEVMAAGHQHYSADAVLHRVRWEADIGFCQDADGFRINNNYSAFYARLFHREYPQHDGFFRTRTSQADQRPETQDAALPETAADYTAPPAAPPADPWPSPATPNSDQGSAAPPIIVRRGFGSVPAQSSG